MLIARVRRNKKISSQSDSLSHKCGQGNIKLLVDKGQHVAVHQFLQSLQPFRITVLFELNEDTAADENCLFGCNKPPSKRLNPNFSLPPPLWGFTLKVSNIKLCHSHIYLLLGPAATVCGCALSDTDYTHHGVFILSTDRQIILSVKLLFSLFACEINFLLAFLG